MSQRKIDGPLPVSRLRLALALIIAPLLLAAFLTLLAYLAAAATESTRSATLARAINDARTFFLYLPLFSLTAGFAGALALLRLEWRGRLAWAGAGAPMGAATAAVLGWITAGIPDTAHVLVSAVLGILMMSLVRGVAGITANANVPPDPPVHPTDQTPRTPPTGGAK